MKSFDRSKAVTSSVSGLDVYFEYVCSKPFCRSSCFGKFDKDIWSSGERIPHGVEEYPDEQNFQHICRIGIVDPYGWLERLGTHVNKRLIFFCFAIELFFMWKSWTHYDLLATEAPRWRWDQASGWWIRWCLCKDFLSVYWFPHSEQTSLIFKWTTRLCLFKTIKCLNVSPQVPHLCGLSPIWSTVRMIW